MGFYGNIQNSNKISLSFDLVYPNRSQMDIGVGTDGVFLGRYVAIDYGEMPIVGYYNSQDGNFYTVRDNQTADTRITPKPNAIYQDITSDTTTFYYWDANVGSGRYTQATEQILSHLQLNSAYVTNYNKDVTKYGAAYDGTVWQKTYDAASNQYKYVLIAELNAKVPSFHLVVDKPTETPVTPYFDRDSTNMDYYLHLAPSYGHRIKKAANSSLSDETALRYEIDYNNVGTTDIHWKEVERTVDGDIYYNKDGFDDAKRTYSNVENTINYDYAKSGRLYGQQEGPVPVAGIEEIDTYDWFFRIPALGNTVCTMWDKLYGYNNRGERYRNFAQKKHDSENNLVTYDRDTIYGVVNEVRDALGYTFIDYTTVQDQLENIGNINNPNTTIKVTNTYIKSNNGTTQSTATYKVLNCIFYNAPLNSGKTGYMVYTYNPQYTAITGEPKAGVTYYIKDNGEYKVANMANYQAKDRNGNDIQPLYSTYYTRTDEWHQSTVITDWSQSEFDDDLYYMFDVYGLIRSVHNLIGMQTSGTSKTRDLKTMQGTINYIKDIIDSIDLNLSPGKMLHINDEGVIEATETYYPSSTTDADRVLVGNPNEGTKQGAWENRVRSLSIIDPNTSDTEWTLGTGTIDTNKNNNNNINFKAGNKWIGLNVDKSNNQLISILHNKSALTKHDFATDVIIDNDIDGSKGKDCEFTIPLAQTDNAGHIIGYTTKTIYIPYNYRNITLEAQSDAEEALTPNDGTKEADATNDTFTFATGNQWITARITEDKLTFAHALIDDTSIGKWEFKTVAENGWQLAEKDGNKITIPTFEIDNAGHIVRNDSVDFYIPHNFRDINVVAATGDDVNSVQTNGKLEADNTVDNWSIASQNKWLRVAADIENDIITIGHSYSSQLAHDFADDVTITQGLDEITQSDNVVILPLAQTDNAGHITGYTTKKFCIPHNFKFIKIVTDNDVDVDSQQNEAILIPDSTTDAWTFAPQNKWIDIFADAAAEKITIGHKYSPIKAWSFTSDASKALKEDNSDNSFTIPTFTTDNAGHIISTGSTTFYVPHTFKTIKVAAQSTVSTAVDPSTSEGNLVAENIVDTLTIATGNKWVQTTTDENNDKITFSHILSGVTKNTYGTNSSSAIEPKFGDTFEVPGYDVDEAGHITSSTTHTVKIPQANYTDKEEGNVLVGFALADNTTSAFEGTHAYVGTLKLNNYSVTNNENAITAEDTINEAFAKTEARLALEIKNRGDADTQVYNNATKYTDERITNLINSAPEALDTLGELASALKNENEEISTTIVSMITANTNLINANTNTINALDASLKVTQTDLNTERDTRIAEDQKLATAIETETKTREEKDKNHEEALNKEIDARERADQARHEEFTNALAVEIEERNSAINEAIATEVSARDEAILVESNNRDVAIAAAVQQILDDLLVNYNITLNPPVVAVSQEGLILTASWDENSADEYSINWFKKQLDADPILVADTAQVQVNEVGEYYCVLTRVHNNHTASTNSEIFIVTEDMLPPPEVEEPETPPEIEEPVTPPEE